MDACSHYLVDVLLPLFCSLLVYDSSWLYATMNSVFRSYPRRFSGQDVCGFLVTWIVVAMITVNWVWCTICFLSTERVIISRWMLTFDELGSSLGWLKWIPNHLDINKCLFETRWFALGLDGKHGIHVQSMQRHRCNCARCPAPLKLESAMWHATIVWTNFKILSVGDLIRNDSRRLRVYLGNCSHYLWCVLVILACSMYTVLLCNCLTMRISQCISSLTVKCNLLAPRSCSQLSVLSIVLQWV